MSRLIITVEATAGSLIEETIKQMIELARRMGVSVECKFNGVTLHASADTDAKGLLARFHCELQTDGMKFAIA